MRNTFNQFEGDKITLSSSFIRNRGFSVEEVFLSLFAGRRRRKDGPARTFTIHVA